MNSLCKIIGLNCTSFTNPHGLSDVHNKSTWNDIALLTWIAMKNQIFRAIVSSRFYLASGFNKFNKPKKVIWFSIIGQILNCYLRMVLMVSRLELHRMQGHDYDQAYKGKVSI